VKARRGPSFARVSIRWPGLHLPANSARTRKEYSFRIDGRDSLTHAVWPVISRHSATERSNGARPSSPVYGGHRPCRAKPRSDVVDIITALGNDWTGEPAVFFTVILSDAAASKHDQLLNVAHRASSFIVRHIEPLEQWGVLPYFTYRSHAEQAKLEPSLA
jgi:hypothetical protein